MMPDYANTEKKPLTNIFCKWLIIWLSDQGSNLDSSDPESDVLPITPSDSYLYWERKIIQFIKR